MKRITLIMTALNEGREPLNTIESIFETANPELFDIILFNDGSDKWVDIPEKYNVKVIHNEIRKGIHYCREEAVRLSETDYCSFFNARMRFTEGWLDKVLDYLYRYPKTIFCTTSVVLWDSEEGARVKKMIAADKKAARTEKDKKDIAEAEKGLNEWHEKTKGFKNLEIIDEEKQRLYGADIIEMNDGSNLIINPIWRKEEEGKCYKIPCVLGANYFFRKKWYNHLRGLEGLNFYGGDEEFLSLKSYAFGGDVRIIKEVEIGNIYHSFKKYTDTQASFFMNKFWYCFLLLDWKDAHRIMCKLFKSERNKDLYPQVLQVLIQRMPELMNLRSIYNKLKTNDVKHLIIKQNGNN